MNKKFLTGQAVILVAGESSRCWPLNNKQHKSQVNILGKPLIYWTVKGLMEKGIKDIIMIIGPNSSLEKQLTLHFQDADINIFYIIQERPIGSGNAIFRAKEIIKGPFFVFWGYEINAGYIAEKILEKYRPEISQTILVGAETSTPWEFGIFKLEKEKIVKLIEKPKKGREPSNIKIIGSYFFSQDFFDYYKSLSQHHKRDFIDVINIYIKNKRAELIILEKELPDLKYVWTYLEIMRIMFDSDRFQKSISKSAIIGKNVVINGDVHIGDNVIIGENTTISGPCFIGKNCKIGPNNVLRGPVNLENDVATGAFTEIKNCIIQQGTHFHSGYFGDSIIGQNCRFGAGFATANRRIDRADIKSVVKGKKTDTGLSYFGSAIGNNTRFGIQSGTMPGVLIGSNCIIGPGTLVFENIEDNTTFFIEFKGIKKSF